MAIGCSAVSTLLYPRPSPSERCLAISYRASDECSPSTRLVDPKFIEVSGDAAYLVAWNVEKDAQRSYRLDRIANAELTDDSVERHDFSPYSAAESLRAHGADATLRFVNSGELASRDWEGIRRGTADEQEDGSVLVHISYHVRAWLFSQIAAAAGAIVIEEPAEPEKRLPEHGAKSLL
ncbi:MAG: WYL domain-containing protein [Collinsella sp.]